MHLRDSRLRLLELGCFAPIGNDDLAHDSLTER